MESIFKIIDLHARDYFVIMMKKNVQDIIKCSLHIYYYLFSPSDINKRKVKDEI